MLRDDSNDVKDDELLPYQLLFFNLITTIAH